MTVLLIVVNTVIFLLEVAMRPGALATFVNRNALFPGHVTSYLSGGGMSPAGVFLPFLTSMFLHAGWLHLIGNMWYLWIFGDV